jgi:hypothetical protein
MNGNGVEQIKWWHAVDMLTSEDFLKGLQEARACQHPDAQWLASFFPPGGVAPTRAQLLEVMREHGDDPRAMFVSWQISSQDEVADDVLQRAARAGYAVAQGRLARHARDFDWAQRAAAQRDRFGLGELGVSHFEGRGFAQDQARGLALIKEAADLECPKAQYRLGKLAYTELDWQRYVLWGSAAARRVRPKDFCSAAIRLAPYFERRELGRVLNTVGAVLRAHLDVASQTVFGDGLFEGELESFQRIVALHEAMLDRARAAIACWSMVGVRCRVVRDVRMLIAELAWGEVWVWGEQQAEADVNSE